MIRALLPVGDGNSCGPNLGLFVTIRGIKHAPTSAQRWAGFTRCGLDQVNRDAATSDVQMVLRIGIGQGSPFEKRCLWANDDGSAIHQFHSGSMTRSQGRQ